MSLADAAKALPDFFAAMQNAPKAPVILRALGRWVSDLVIREAIAVGPTRAWVDRMTSAGWSHDDAVTFYEATLTDAIGRTMIEEPKSLHAV